MPRGTEIYTFKRDNAIVAILKEHKGRKNAIKSMVLSNLLRERGYNLHHTAIHNVITKLINERDLPIVSSATWGYCWGVTKEDFVIARDELISKVEELNRRIDHYNKFIIN